MFAVYVGGGSPSPLFERSYIPAMGPFSGSSPLSRELSSPVVSPPAPFCSCFFSRRPVIPWQTLVLPWTLECLKLQAPLFLWSRRARPPFLSFILYLGGVHPSAGSATGIAPPSCVRSRRDALSRCSSLQWSVRPAHFGVPRSPILSNAVMCPSITAKVPGAASVLLNISVAPTKMDLGASFRIFTCVPFDECASSTDQFCSYVLRNR